ncbi:MAG: CoA-binding protein, partial [Betaproteobacteria bacterium]|nr:CoA-binding protein [Betaproteobacteria bacterium]MBV9361485.1 CoA-binding protein [Betaproteobacteria bacterium]
MRLAQALFAPRAVALIGASGDPKKNTARPQRYLKKHGYSGRIVPINATRGDVLGERAYKSVAEAPVDIDHAFIMVEEVEQALEDCGRKRVPVVSIYSNGFADAGADGAKRQEKLAARARQLGIRLLGPNSMGVVDLPGRVALTVNAVLEMDAPPSGGTSLISQSGTMLGTLLSRGAARGLGYAKLISIGNEADLGVGELVELLIDDADTRVIALFLETVRDAKRLAGAARKAHAAGKPIVAYKLGRSALGEELARTHTGALAGIDKALDAYFRDCGIVRVDMLETLVEIPPLLAGRAPAKVGRPPRVAVVTTTGGGAASVVDRLGLQGLELASMHDLTMTSTKDIYRSTLEKLLASPDCDAVLAAVGSSAQFHPEFAVQPILEAKRAAKPLAAFLTPHAERSLALLAERGIPAFRTPEACADAFASFFAWRAPRQFGARTRINFDPGPDSFAAMRNLGIPVAEHAVVEAPGFKHPLAYPVALKRLDVEHKTEVSGVVLNVGNHAELVEHAKRMRQPRLLVQRMERGLAEAIVGYRRDPIVGPLVLV